MNRIVKEMSGAKQITHQSVRLVILLVIACGLSGACLAQDYQTRVTQIDQRIFDCKVKIQQLEREKERAVEEMRQGLFCSECQRSKSEIERATRESFADHLKRVHGHAVANPQMLADKAAFYDRQIAALQKQIADLEKMKGQLADAARQTADFERQRAAAEQQRQQREREQERLRQMKAQQEKLQQERDRIVNKANAIADSYRQAGQAAADGIKQIGDILAQKMERDRLEREQQREQKRYDRQMEALDEKIRAQEEQVSRTEKDQSAGARNGDNDGGFRLPAPVQLQEPPSEDQIARGQTGIFSPIRNPGEDLLLAGGGKPSDRSMFDVARSTEPEAPYTPPQRFSELFQDSVPKAGNSGSDALHDLAERAAAFRESVTDTVQAGADRWKERFDFAKQSVRTFAESTWFKNYVEDRALDVATGKEPDFAGSAGKKALNTAVDSAALEKYSQLKFGKPYDDLDLADQTEATMDVKWTLDAIRYGDGGYVGYFKWVRNRGLEFKKSTDSFVGDIEKDLDR